MVAISHATTALLVKRCFPQASMVWILAAAELPALLWLAAPHLHTLLTLLSAALAAWLLIGKVLRRRALGAALVAAILLHVGVDLVLHVEELPLLPYPESVRIGLALDGVPPLAAAIGLAYGLLCWLIFGGSKALLAAILLLGMAQLTFQAAPAAHIAAAGLLVWTLSRRRAAELEHPDHRLARAFA
jgi:hypothetical protein